MFQNPEPPRDPKKPGQVTPARIAIWLAVGAIGLYLVITGLVGIIVKGG